MNKPYAQSSDDNKDVILEQLKNIFSGANKVLEIGSGTGQHAVHFARHLPHLEWQPTELSENIAGIKLWLDEASLENINQPKILDVEKSDWSFDVMFDGVFTANTLHIMSIVHVQKLFEGVDQVLEPGGVFTCYGPFNKNNQFSSESNARFDLWLKQRDALSGIRDMEQLLMFAGSVGMQLVEDIEMPVNNRLLVWRKD